MSCAVEHCKLSSLTTPLFPRTAFSSNHTPLPVNCLLPAFSGSRKHHRNGNSYIISLLLLLIGVNMQHFLIMLASSGFSDSVSEFSKFVWLLYLYLEIQRLQQLIEIFINNFFLSLSSCLSLAIARIRMVVTLDIRYLQRNRNGFTSFLFILLGDMALLESLLNL